MGLSVEGEIQNKWNGEKERLDNGEKLKKKRKMIKLVYIFKLLNTVLNLIYHLQYLKPMDPYDMDN